MNDVVIEFKNVSKTYKLYKNEKMRLLGAFFKRIPYIQKNANSNLSFTIQRGEAVAIFGKNGAGKSTLLKIITQVIYPTKGKVKIHGRVSALLELTAGFDLEFTGRENIYFKGSLMGLSKEDINHYEQIIIDFAELGPYIDQPVRTYSSGMKARLGFAINANIDPEILIIDEALSVGDAAFRLKCQIKINEIMALQNSTVLLVTHSTTTAKDFCKRGLVMRDGKLVFDGDILDAIKNYEDSLVKKKKKKKKVPKPVELPTAATPEVPAAAIEASKEGVGQ